MGKHMPTWERNTSNDEAAAEAEHRHCCASLSEADLWGKFPKLSLYSHYCSMIDMGPSAENNVGLLPSQSPYSTHHLASS